MKICFIANSASEHSQKWAKHFIDKGHDVYIISNNLQEIEGAKNYYIKYSLKNFFVKSFSVHSLINKINPDILHAQAANTCGFYAVTSRKYKAIVSSWGSDILITPNISVILNKIIRYVVKNAKYVTSDSYFMSEKICELGAEKDNIFTFPMGVENDILNFKHIYVDNNKLNIVSLRRHEDLYNIDIIIKGFYEASKVNANIYLNIAASGGETEELKSLVNKLNLQDKVEFTGRYNPKDVGTILEKSDLFISIPSSDSTSVSLLESMAVGVYPVVSNLPANREWIKDKENGLVIEDISVDSVKNAILWCCENKNAIINCSEDNINLIKDKALWSENIKIVESIYEKYLQNVRNSK